MREGIKRTPMELLRTVVEEQLSAGCDALHEIHGDNSTNVCYGRRCFDCVAEGFRKAADLVEAELDALKARALPEGMEWLVEAWPRFEDDAPLKFGDMALIDGEADMVEAVQLWIHGKPVIYGDGGSQQLEKGERVKRPAPKVLDADGVEIRVGDDVWDMDATRRKVRCLNEDGTVEFEGHEDRGWFAWKLTHRAPVIAADGKPLREGEHVYHVETGAELVVKELPKPGEYQAVVVFAPPASHLTSFDPDQLTHERPDSWDALFSDATKGPCDYFGRASEGCGGDGDCPAQEGSSCIGTQLEDLVRRAKKLAGVER